MRSVPFAESDVDRGERRRGKSDSREPGSQGRRAYERAAAWLASAPVKSTEDLDMQLLGLKWAGKPQSAWLPGMRKLASQQREDGGWAQTPDLPSDAYATGQALFTMHELGVPSSDPA